MENIFNLSEYLNAIPLPTIAGLLWLSWLVAVVFLLVLGKGKIPVLHGKLLIPPSILLILWRILILVSAGSKPIVDRVNLAGIIRLLDCFAILCLWLWLIIVIKERIKMTDLATSKE